MKGKGIESIFDATHQWFPLSYWVTYERLCFLFFGALFPPNCYKCLYFFLVALYVIPELYKFSFPVIFTWPECAPGTLSSSQGPNSFLPLVTLTLAVLCLLLLHHQDRSCYLVSSHTLSANATCTFEHLARLFPDLSFLTDTSPGFLSLAGLQHSHPQWSWRRAAAPEAEAATFELSSFFTLWKWEQQNYKSTSVIYPSTDFYFSLSLCKILITVKEIWSSTFIFHALLPDVR